MILLTGATGNVGRHLVDILVAARSPVRALVRDPGNARALGARGIDGVAGSFEDHDALGRALVGVDRVERLLGRPPRDFGAFVRDHRDRLTLIPSAG